MSAPLSTSGPPYAPVVAGLGGLPTVAVDVPITAVFLALYILGAVGHMTILQLNQKRSHKFLASGALFGFCMSRIATCVMRIVWACRPTSVPIAIAAGVFTNAGVVIIIVINVIFSQRILRASHPNFGWQRAIHYAFLGYYVSIGLMLVMLITVLVLSFYTTDQNTLRISHDIVLLGGTYNAVASFIPIVITILATIIPRSNNRHVEKFGSGRYRTKIRVVLSAAFLIAIGATFRCVIAYYPRPGTNPGWYTSRTCFYCFVFLVEIIVIYMYILVRVDRRFHVPNGSKGPGDYSAEQGAPKPTFTTEEEFLDEGQQEENVDRAAAADWEKRAEQELESGMNASPAVRPA